MNSDEPRTLGEEIEEAGRGAAEPGQKEPLTAERRLFLEWMSLALAGFAAAMISIPIIGVVLAPLLNAPRGVWRVLGAVDKYRVGDVVEATYLNPSPDHWAGLVARNAVWLRRDSTTDFTAYAISCQHLGCPVRWEQGAQLFFCPCHGGVYYANGDVAAGPPQRPLQKYPVRVRNGRVEVFTGVIPVPQFPVPGQNESPQST